MLIWSQKFIKSKTILYSEDFRHIESFLNHSHQLFSKVLVTLVTLTQLSNQCIFKWVKLGMNLQLFWPAPACPLLNMLNVAKIYVWGRKIVLGQRKKLHHSFFPIFLKGETLYTYVFQSSDQLLLLGVKNSLSETEYWHLWLMSLNIIKKQSWAKWRDLHQWKI